jgi:hypothetical protein
VRARRSGGVDADQRAIGREREDVLGRRHAVEPAAHVQAAFTAAVVEDQRDAALGAHPVDRLGPAVGRQRRDPSRAPDREQRHRAQITIAAGDHRLRGRVRGQRARQRRRVGEQVPPRARLVAERER